MSCSINRYKFVGSSGNTRNPTVATQNAKELEARMKDMLEMREYQDIRYGATQPMQPMQPMQPTLATQSSKLPTYK